MKKTLEEINNRIVASIKIQVFCLLGGEGRIEEMKTLEDCGKKLAVLIRLKDENEDMDFFNDAQIDYICKTLRERLTKTCRSSEEKQSIIKED